MKYQLPGDVVPHVVVVPAAETQSAQETSLQSVLLPVLLPLAGRVEDLVDHRHPPQPSLVLLQGFSRRPRRTNSPGHTRGSGVTAISSLSSPLLSPPAVQ